MAKKCPPGKYYCFDDKKCKKIPRGYHIGARGYLARDDDNETKKNGNGNSNGNGNGGNGAGNGNGGSGGGANGNGGGVSEEVIHEILDKKDVPHVRKLVKKLRAGSKTHAKQADDLEVAMKEGMYNHPEFALITVAVDELEKGLMNLEGITHDSVDKLMQGIAKRNNISPTLLHNQFKSKHLTIPDDWAIKQRMRRMREGVEDVLATPVFSSKKSKNMSSIKKITSVPVKKAKVVEEKMTEKEMEKREDIVKGMKKNKSGFKKRYGKDAKSVMYATATKLAMKEESQEEMLSRVRAAQDKLQTKKEIKDKVKKQVTPRIHPQKGEIIDDGYKYNVSEEGLRDWFGKSSGTTKSGRKVRGWVQVGGKYDGKPCARQPGQKSTPKCVSSSKRRSMSDKERDSAARRKRAADPNQPQKSGAAKPTNVSTDPKRKMKENYFNRNKVVEGYKGTADLSKSHPEALKKVEDKIAKHFGKPKKKDKKVVDEALTAGAVGTAAALGAAGGAASAIAQNLTNKAMKKKKKIKIGESKQHIDEAKDKKGKGSGTKDACYHKVKSRYSVWPSAYASGALVKCRKVGAANWGNKSKNEGFSPMQVAALEVAGMIEINEAGKKCWKGYKKAGTQKLFGKTYNRCVKAGDELNHDGESLQEMNPSFDIKGGEASKQMTSDSLKSKRKNQRNEKIRNLANNPGTEGEGGAALAKKKPQAELPKFESYAPVTEGVAFLKRKKEKKNSEVERKPKKAMDAGARLRRKKQRQEYAAKISGSEDNVPDDIRDHVELTAESKTRLVKNGHTYKVILTWRGKTYMVQMFVPSVSRPTRVQIEKEVQKLYPDAKVMSFLPRDLEPGEPTVMMGEEQDSEINKKIKNIKDDPRLKKIEKDPKGAEIKSKIEKETGTNIRPYSEGQNYEFMKQYAQKEKEKKMKKEVKKNLGTYEGDEQHNTRMGEEYIYIGEVKLPLRSASKRLPGGAPNKELGLDFDLSGVPDKRPTKEPEKRPYTKMSHAERVKDNKRIQAAKDAANPDKAEKQRIYQKNLAKNPAVIARKKAIKDGRYPKYGNDISFADIGRKNQDMRDTAKKGYHVNKPREVYDDDPIPPKPKQEKSVDSQNKISKFDSGKQGGGVRKKVPVTPNKGGAEVTGSRNMSLREDDMKGMSVSSGHKRPTKSGAGMTAKGVAAYRRKNPGSKLQTAVTGKVKKGSKDAKRRKSYCARSAGQMKKFPKAAKDPNSRLRQARRRWKC